MTEKPANSKKNTKPGLKPVHVKDSISLKKHSKEIPPEIQSKKKSKRLMKKKAQTEKPPEKNAVPAKLYLHDQFHAPLTFFQRMNARNGLGLDIDADKVRYAVVKKTKDDVQVLQWGVQKFPSEEKDRKKALQIALENIKAKVYKRGMIVNVSIFSPEISSRHLIFPAMKKETDLKQAIFHKNETDLQNFNEKSIWTYEIIDRFESEGLKKLRISVIAVPNEIVEDYVHVFNQAGLEMNHLIPRPSAIQAAYRRMIFRPGRDLLIDIGYDLTQMCFLKNGHVEFVRNVSIGSRNLEVSIHNKPEEAGDASAAQKSPAADKLADSPEQMRNRLLGRIKDLKKKQNPVLHTFFSEILRSMAFFQGKDVQQYIERIFVTGYGIRKESLLPYLKSRLNIPLFILTPQFEDMPTRTTEFGEYFSTLGTIIHDGSTANILPQSYKNKFIFKKLNAVLSALLIVLTLVIGFITVGEYNLISQKKKTILKARQEYEQLNPIEGKYLEIQSLINDVNKKNKELKGYIQSKPPVIEILRLFSNEVPATIRLEKLDFIRLNQDAVKKKFRNDYKFQLDIDGVITSDPLMSDVVLINFVNHLNELKYFKHIELLNKLKETELKTTRFGLRLFL